MDDSIWEVPIEYIETDDSYGGWTKSVKLADDLPLVILSISIRDNEEDGEEDRVWYADSYVWVADGQHDLAPAFINTPTNIGVLLGGGTALAHNWISNSYADINDDVDELIEDCREYTEYIFEQKPDWFVSAVRYDLEEELRNYSRHLNSSK